MRSTDGQKFSLIGISLAETAKQDYAFTDSAIGLSAPAMFYRLKMISEDGSYSYSNILAFRKGSNVLDELRIYPDPVIAQASISLSSTKNTKAEILLINTNGVILNRQKINIAKGTNVFPLNRVSSLAPGVYTIRVISDQKAISTLCIIK
jgi:hypothetical protein